jgi:undecaprenyl-diphosphatase
VNGFDLTILTWLNQFARRWYLLDVSLYHLAWFNFLKGTPFVLAMTLIWLTRGESRRRNREIVVATVIAAICAIILGRLAANGLPFRLRPMERADIQFLVPYGAEGDTLRFWSAFPSDTAMVFSALATGFWFVSPRLGLAAHAYAFLVIGMPRVYLGMHHPTDLLAGAAFGIATNALFTTERVRRRIASWPLRLADAFPNASAVLAMFMALQVATMFDDVRVIARGSRLVGRAVLCHVTGGTGCTDPQADEIRSKAAAARLGPPAQTPRVSTY